MNLINKDVVFTGGDDSTVFGWRISEQKSTLPTKKLNKKFLNVSISEYHDFLLQTFSSASLYSCLQIDTHKKKCFRFYF